MPVLGLLSYEQEPHKLSIAGINVSHYNGEIDWHAAADSISFAFARATNGPDFIDPQFASNWKAMKEAGIARGAYHFFDPREDAAAQAKLFLGTVNFEAEDLPPVLDIERRCRVTATIAVKRLGECLEIVQSATGRTPVVYTSGRFWRLLGNRPRPCNAALWISHHDVPSPFVPRAWDEWTFWHFSQLGRCSGIQGYVDLSRFSGSLEQLRNMGRTDLTTERLAACGISPDFAPDVRRAA